MLLRVITPILCCSPSKAPATGQHPRWNSQHQTSYAEFLVSAITYAHGFFNVNYADFANAVNDMDWWLGINLGCGENLRHWHTLALMIYDTSHIYLELSRLGIRFAMLNSSP